MTEIEPYLPHLAEPTELTRWVNEFREVATISAQLARTHFVPTSLHVWRKRDGQDWFDAEATTAQVARETTCERTFASCPSVKSGWRA